MCRHSSDAHDILSVDNKLLGALNVHIYNMQVVFPINSLFPQNYLFVDIKLRGSISYALRHSIVFCYYTVKWPYFLVVPSH